jgi:hypothetical protein
MSMAVRTILAALVAISVAVVPIAGEAAITTMQPVVMSMPDSADMPCCPYCNEQDHSKSSGACSFKCLNFVGIVPPAKALTQPYLVDATPPLFVTDALHGYVTSPPTHPPPV